MKKSIIAWLIFFGGLGLEICIDYILRVQDGSIRTGGIPEPLWFFIQIILGAISIWLGYLGTNSFIKTWKRLLVLAIEVGLGILAYVFIVLIYVIY